jgi:putative colanic acid biosynthesis acetyltransferase WcaF
MKLITAPIVIKDQAWVCAAVFVAPGVTVQQGAVAGARSVVTKDIPPWTVVAGNPATEIKHRQLRAG